MQMSGSSPNLMDVVLRFFSQEQWNYQVLDKKPAIRTGYRGEHGTWICYAHFDEPHRRLTFYSLLGMNIPPQQRGAVMEYLARVNYSLPFGNFEMDLNSGDARFKTAYSGPAADLTMDIVHALVYANVHAMDHFYPGLVQVLYSGLSPEAALARLDAQDLESVSGM